MTMVLGIIGALMLGALIGAILGKVLWHIYLDRREQRLHLQRQASRHSDLLDSLEVICRAVIQKQMDLSEAVIRLDVLLDSVPEGTAPKVDLSAIHQLAQQCQQFSRGEARKALSARDRNRQDVQRWHLESQHMASSTRAIEQLFEVIPRWREQLVH